MKNLPLFVFGVAFAGGAFAQTVTRDVRYAESTHERHMLDVYAPAGAKDAPVVFWVHGGGWQGGDKANVQVKPKVFNERGIRVCRPEPQVTADGGDGCDHP